MARSEAQVLVRESVWEGGVRPYGIGSKKTGMWLFLLSDTLTFTALIVAYSWVRIANEDWPHPFPWSAVMNALVMTLVLLSSSLTMVLAVHAAHHEQRKKAARFIVFTMIGGIAFIVLHLSEWYRLIVEEQVTPMSNPKHWPPLFGGTFFTLTGMHMLHVTIGVIYLGVIAFGFGRNKFTSEDVEVSGLYWHFVDLVWMFIFPLVYLMSNQMA
jgi:cytochrome c oxidase subunit 3